MTDPPDREPATRATERPVEARPPERADEGDGRFRVRRFDADRTDEALTFADALASPPSGRQLLWIDIAGRLAPDEASGLAERFGLDGRSRRELHQTGDRPLLALHGDYLHLRLVAEPDDERPERSPWLQVVAGRNVVITRHEGGIGFLGGMDERIENDTTIGLLDAATFAASILDAVVTSYFKAIDAIEDQVDQLDARSLQDAGRHALLDELVAVRRRIARLRRLLTDHRELFASLASADVAHVAGSPASSEGPTVSDSPMGSEGPAGTAHAQSAKGTESPDPGPLFQAVASRFESAIGAVEDSRETLLGSFDVFMTRTAQRTNDVMKVLAFATVLLLPGSLIAGLLGMNVDVPLSKDDPRVFWAVVGAVLLLAVGVFVVARLRRWL